MHTLALFLSQLLGFNPALSKVAQNINNKFETLTSTDWKRTSQSAIYRKLISKIKRHNLAQQTKYSYWSSDTIKAKINLKYKRQNRQELNKQ